ncbi:MAG: hypothetical protein IJJ83_04500 [Muribaculaceae bacterium]|nr:hypothetical protein [Muribaculaceae bacterium]
MMKKLRFLITLMLMLVAASSYAQDSYREAVKEYMTALDQFEDAKSKMSTISMIFKRDGQVDIDQLTNRYFDEQLKNELLDYSVSTMASSGITEADLKEMASLLTTPQGKSYKTHIEDMATEFSKFMHEPFMVLMEKYSKQTDEMVPYEPIELWPGFSKGAPVQRKAEIDDAYAAKFNSVIMESVIGKSMIDAMKKSVEESPYASQYDDVEEYQKSYKEGTDRIINSVPTIMLNCAFGILTLEDLDYGAMLMSNDTYCKFVNSNLTVFETNYGEAKNMAQSMYLNYLQWMEGNGAKVTEDPEVLVNIYKSLFNFGD